LDQAELTEQKNTTNPEPKLWRSLLNRSGFEFEVFKPSTKLAANLVANEPASRPDTREREFEKHKTWPKLKFKTENETIAYCNERGLQSEVFEKNKYLKSTQTQQLELELIAYNEDCQNWQELRNR